MAINTETKRKVLELIETKALSRADAAKKYGVSKNTIYNWSKKFAGDVTSTGESSVGLKRELSFLRTQNAKLKSAIADLYVSGVRGFLDNANS